MIPAVAESADTVFSDSTSTILPIVFPWLLSLPVYFVYTYFK